MDDIELRFQAVHCLLHARRSPDGEITAFLRELAELLVNHADDLKANKNQAFLLHE